MAKKNVKVAFSKAELTVEDGDYVLTETGKDYCNIYNLSKILDTYVGTSNVSLTISVDDELEAEVEE